MKKLLLIAALLCSFGFGVSLSAQNSYRQYVATATGPDSAVNETAGGINYHLLTWTVSGTVSTCTVALDSSSDGVTWTSGGAISGQTCTSAGNSGTVAGTFAYVRIDVTALSGAGATVNVVYTGYNSSGGSSIVLQTNGTNNSSQSLLNLTAGTGIALSNTSGGDVSVTASGGGASSGTNLVQVSNGSGGFISSPNLRADTTNGYLGIRNDTTAPQTPLDMEWGGLADGSSGETLATFGQTITSTSASPGNTHEINLYLTYGGSDGAFTDTTDAMLYADETDNRTPTVTSTSGHELGIVSRFNFNGGTNLTCIDGCGAFYATAGTGAVGNVTSLFNYFADGGSIDGTGTVGTWTDYIAGFPLVGGTASLNNIYGVEASDPAAASHGLGSGCAAAYAVLLCSGSNAYAFFSASTAGSGFAGGLALGSTSLSALGGTRSVVGDFEGGVNIGSTSGGTHPPLCFYSYSSGSPTACINAISGGQTLKLPSDSVTINGTAGNYDTASAVTGNIAAQTLFAFPDGNLRFFRLDVYGVCTSAVAASIVTVNLTYTDEQQAQTQSSTAQSCAAAGDIIQWSTNIYAKTSNVQVSTTTANSPVYLLHARLTLLGPNVINSQ